MQREQGPSRNADSHLVPADRRSFVKRTAAATGLVWVTPIVLGTLEPIAAATGSSGEPFTFDFDDGTTQGWVIDNTAGSGNGLWNINAGRSVSPSFSLHYGTGIGGNYNTGTTNSGTVTSPPFTVPSVGGFLTFEIWREVEVFGSGTWDEFSASILPSGTVEYAVSRDGGTGGLFEPISIDLGVYAGSTIQVVFAFDTGDANFNNFEGIWVDNVSIPCENVPPANVLSANGSLSTDRTTGANVFAPRRSNSRAFFPDRPDPSPRELADRRTAMR